MSNLKEWSEEARRLEIGKYRHYKGNEYLLIGVSRHSETLEELVIYRSLHDNGDLWARPLSMFVESVEIDGKKISRFEHISH